MGENTFLSRKPVTLKTDFVGREMELEWFHDLLSRPIPQNCNLIGQPRIGKTSLLFALYDQKLGLPPDIQGLYVWLRLVELQQPDAPHFWRTLLLKLQEEAQRNGCDMQPNDGETAETFSQVETLVEYLLVQKKCRRIIFLLDEFDVLKNHLNAHDYNWMRSLITRFSHGLAFVISSVEPLAIITRNEQDISPLANYFEERWLSLFTLEAAQNLCQRAAAAEGLEPLSASDVQFLLREAGRHPALLKVACRYLFAARRWGSGQSSYDDARGDFRFDTSVRWLCHVLYNERRPEEQEILRRLALDQLEAPYPMVMNRLRRQIGLVELRDGKPALFADVFAYWLRDHMRQTEEPESEGGSENTAVSSAAELQPMRYTPGEKRILIANREEKLTPLQDRLLTYLLAHAGEVCTSEELLENVWGPNRSPSVVEKAINRLREKIEPDPKRPTYILSVRGKGYQLKPD